MIASLTGVLREKDPAALLIETDGGVGYAVQVPMSTFYVLPPAGERVRLLTHQVVREDGVFLFGFASPEERAVFRELIAISGIGPRLALAVLSGLTLTELKEAVLRQDAARLTKLPGIGKKTAERLLLELKDKLARLPWGQTTRSHAASGAVPDEAPRQGQEPTAADLATSADAPDEALLVARDVQAALAALGYGDAQIAPLVARLPAGLDTPAAIRWALKQLIPR